MPKFIKQKYKTKNGDVRTFSYLASIPKRVLKNSDLSEDDEIAVYEWYGDIVITKKYHCTCMECGYEWESGKDLGIQTMCPKCKVGDIRYDINGGNNDNQKQGTEKNA